MATDGDTLVELNNVTKLFDVTVGVTDRILRQPPEPVHAVERVDLEIKEGEVVGIAGESGCGKTTLGKLLVKLHDPTHGEIRFDGKDITTLTREEERLFRERVQMIFQDPFESLNPRMTVLDTVAEPLRINDLPNAVRQTDHPVDVTTEGGVPVDVEVAVHEDAEPFLDDETARVSVGIAQEGETHDVELLHDKQLLGVDLENEVPGLHIEARVEEIQREGASDAEPVLRVAIHSNRSTYHVRRQRVINVLNDVGLSPAETYLDQFPRELSGGERQRVAIARALVVDPEFIVADEPVSMLDVSIRASVLNLMQDLRDQYDLTYLFISHDLSLIRYMCDRTGIMYLGDLVELGDTDEVVENPQHPYTKALFDAVPKIDPERERHRANVTGEVPSARNPPAGCKFHPRCESVIPPDDWQGSGTAFRRTLNFKLKIKHEELDVEDVDLPEDAPEERKVDALLERGLALDVPEEHRLAGEDPKEGVDLSQVDIPSGVEQRLRESARDLIQGDREAAYERLDEAYRSICENVRPRRRPANEQLTACHLYGSEEQHPAVEASAADD